MLATYPRNGDDGPSPTAPNISPRVGYIVAGPWQVAAALIIGGLILLSANLLAGLAIGPCLSGELILLALVVVLIGGGVGLASTPVVFVASLGGASVLIVAAIVSASAAVC